MTPGLHSAGDDDCSRHYSALSSGRSVMSQRADQQRPLLGMTGLSRAPLSDVPTIRS